MITKLQCFFGIHRWATIPIKYPSFTPAIDMVTGTKSPEFVYFGNDLKCICCGKYGGHFE